MSFASGDRVVVSGYAGTEVGEEFDPNGQTGTVIAADYKRSPFVEVSLPGNETPWGNWLFLPQELEAA